MVRCPATTRPPQLAESRDRAVARFIQQEAKLQKHPALKEEHSKVIQEYIDLGHMRAVSCKESKEASSS